MEISTILEETKKAAPVMATQEQRGMEKPMSDYEKALREYCECARKADRYQFEAHICLLTVLRLLAEHKETVMEPASSKAVLEILLGSVSKCSEVGDNTLTITVHITEPADFRKYCEAALEYAINYLGE